MPLPQTAMRVRRKNRLPISLDRRLDHKLLGYTVAASAAGVGVLALALPSQAEIVYTVANQTISGRGGIALDLNHDGITDFTIGNGTSSCTHGPSCRFQELIVSANAPNGVLATYGANLFAQPLPAFAMVGLGRTPVDFAFVDRCLATRTSRTSSGSWRGPGATGYLGLAFSIDGQIHYGWARLKVSIDWKCNAHILLTGYAYQTIAGEPIRAGETVNHKTSTAERPRATLGALAAGSVSLEAWRRDDD
jgi:hypothetical protein